MYWYYTLKYTMSSKAPRAARAPVFREALRSRTPAKPPGPPGPNATREHEMPCMSTNITFRKTWPKLKRRRSGVEAASLPTATNTVAHLVIISNPASNYVFYISSALAQVEHATLE